jgi:PTS system cellobiose-specific IIC component
VVGGKTLPIGNLGPGGMFMALIIGLLVPEVQRLARKYKLEIRLPDGVPPAVGRSFSALVPGLAVLAPIWALVYVARVDLFGLINKGLTEPILYLSKGSASGGVGVVFLVLLAIILIDSVLWLLGVHAVAILAPMQAIWLTNMGLNIDAVSAGHAAQYLNTREMLVFFVWLGGSGATVVLPFLLLRAKSASLRAIAKIGLLPAIFNINEPLIFGVPIVMNATLLVPFVLAPTVALTTSVLAMHFHLVPVPSVMVPWTLPGPIGAFLSTGYSWRAAVLSLINIALAALIYWPFIRALDCKMAEMEAPVEAAAPARVVC